MYKRNADVIQGNFPHPYCRYKLSNDSCPSCGGGVVRMLLLRSRRRSGVLLRFLGRGRGGATLGRVCGGRDHNQVHALDAMARKVGGEEHRH
jgi:hypothetical protein